MMQGPPPPFKLSHITSPNSHKTLTTMPSQAALDKLNLLSSRSVAAIIKKCLTEIYSYVTQRCPTEGADHFFIHVAATVHYENFHNCFIKGYNHGIKAGGTVNHIQKTLIEIQKELANSHCTDTDRVLLTLFRNLLFVHQNAIYFALKNTTPETKEHNKTFNGVDADTFIPHILSTDELAAVLACYPPSEGTPKRKTIDTERSIHALGAVPPHSPKKNRARKKLQMSEESATIPAAAAAAAPPPRAADPSVAIASDNLEAIFTSMMPPSLTWAYSDTALPSAWSNANNDESCDEENDLEANPSTENSDSDESHDSPNQSSKISKRRGKFF